MLKIYHELPDGLLESKPHDLQRILGGPSLIHLNGRRSDPLFVSLLQHGNEDTGFWAMIRLLRRYQSQTLPRSLSLFIGNVAAAEQGVRRLEEQPDYNRVWPGGDHPDSEEAKMMAQVTDLMAQHNVFASIDLHNNTGINPHYGCVNKLDAASLQLARLFGRTVIYFIRPTGVQSLAFSAICPSVTVECGQVGSQFGVEHAFEFLDAALRIEQFSGHALRHHDIELFHTVAQIRVPDTVRFSFNDDDSDLQFVDDLDHLNFRELPAGSSLGWLKKPQEQPLQVWDEANHQVATHYFDFSAGEIQLRRPAMLSMLTLNAKIIRQDCLGYLMERYPLSEHLE